VRPQILIIVLCLLGCDDGKQSGQLWQDYIGRLERVLETEIAAQSVMMKPYPTRKALRISPRKVTIDIVDFLALLDCDLSRVVASRNAILGKVMQASQQWLYEAELIKALQECIAVLSAQEEPAEVVAKLKGSLAIKTSELPAIVWNATYAGPEFQVFMSAREGTLATDFKFADYADLTSALAQLTQWAAKPLFPGQSADYEKANQQLITYAVYGRLLLSIKEATNKLEAVSAALQRKLAERPLCFHQQPNRKATILKNILANVYNARVQPYLAELNKAYKEWHQLLYQLASGLPSDPLDNFSRAYLSQTPNSVYGLFQQASVKHAKQWTKLLESCGLKPGGS